MEQIFKLIFEKVFINRKQSMKILFKINTDLLTLEVTKLTNILKVTTFYLFSLDMTALKRKKTFFIC